MTLRRVLPCRLVLLCALPALAQPRGGTAVIAVSGDPGHLNPAISIAGPRHSVAGALFNGPVALDDAGGPIPDLAESWQGPPDGLTATFRLRAACAGTTAAPSPPRT
jgi:peptide/nickel transport system substrate-binding protein